MQAQKLHVSDLVDIMEQLAPSDLAEEWDNCGLQVGSLQWPVKKIWVALDPLLPIIKAAVDHDVDMVITHHPLVFQPLKRIDLETIVGQVIGAAVKGNTAIYAAHTNLDSAFEGINDALAEKIGLEDLIPLVPAKLPFGTGDADASMSKQGLGRVGRLNPAVTVDQLALRIKKEIGTHQVRVAGDPQIVVDRAAVCSGSGAGLMDAFLMSDAQVYISGDLKYHDARTVEAAGRAMIDVGHFHSEHIMIEPLVSRLQKAIGVLNGAAQVEACQMEQDPFRLI